jgi:glycosyltransferase involved in cell wall biosynthesis
MPVKNAELHIREAIDSILRQSFEDFELLVIDYGSTDNTISIVDSYTDSRICLIKDISDFTDALNQGMSLSKGEFIARMDADNIMHSERLRIQLKRMKLNPDITICSTWVKPFMNEGVSSFPYEFGDEYIEDMPLHILRGNIFIQSAAIIIKKSFLVEQKIRYQNYSNSEDCKLWFEIVVNKGISYIEPQYLLNYRIYDKRKTKEQREANKRIQQEVLNYLLDQNRKDHPEIFDIYQNLSLLHNRDLISHENIIDFFLSFLQEIKIN